MNVLEKIKKAAAKATPGPWYGVLGADSADIIIEGGDEDTGDGVVADCHYATECDDNVLYIVLAANNAPALVDVIEKCEAALKEADHETCLPGDCPACDQVREALDAIAKLKGERPEC